MGALKRWSGTRWDPVKRWSGTRWDLVYSYDGAWKPEGPPATPTVIGHTEAVGAPAGSTTLTPVLPPGVQEGDLLLLAMMTTDGSVAVSVTPTVPAGWGVRSPLANQGTCQRAFYETVYTLGLLMPSWVLSAARRSGYSCVAVRPIIGTVEAETDLASSSANLVAPSVTAGGAGVVVRQFVRKDNLSTDLSLPAGHTLIGKAIGAAAGPAAHVMACSAPVASAVAVGTATSVCTAASANGTAWTTTVH